jgi:hypothetical protein
MPEESIIELRLKRAGMGIVVVTPSSRSTELTALLGGLEDAMRRLGYGEPFCQAVALRFEAAAKRAETIAGRINFSTWPEYVTLDESVVRAAKPLLKRLADAAATEMRLAILTEVVIPELIELMRDGPGAPSGGSAA